MFDFLKEPDKKGHFWKSMMLTFVFFLIAFVWLDVLYSIAIASVVVFFVGFGKEVINDKLLERGIPDVMDMAANILGILFAAFIVIAIGLIFLLGDYYDSYG